MNINIDIDTLKKFLDKVKSGQDITKEDAFEISSLPEYLKHESWLPNDALLLLAGICPEAAVIDYSYKNYLGAEIDSVHIHHASPLSITNESIYEIPSKHQIYDEIHDVKEYIRDWEGSFHEDLQKTTKSQEKLAFLEELINDEAIINKANIIRPFEKKLSTIKSLWNSSLTNTTDRQPKEYFIDWAISKDIDIDWLEWAKGKGYFTHSESESSDTSSKELSTREKNTLLKIIAALVKIQYGWDGKQQYPMAKEIADDAQEKGFKLSERTLGEKLKEAAEFISSD